MSRDASTENQISNDVLKSLEKIEGRHVQPKIDYWLFHDFYGHGGKRVRLVKKEPARLHWKGTRGEVAIMKSQDGEIFIIGPKNVVAGKKAEPETKLTRSANVTLPSKPATVKKEANRNPEEAKISNEILMGLDRFEQKDIQMGVDYWLYHDFEGHGGERVRLVDREPAKTHFHGMRGEVAIMRNDRGMLFAISPKGVVAGKPVKPVDAPVMVSAGSPRRPKGP